MKSCLILAMLLGLASFFASEASAQEPPKKTCFKLVKIDTPASHGVTQDEKSYIGNHDDVINPDGTIRSTIKGAGNRYVGSTWTINPKAGTANYNQVGPAGSAQVTFTPLPEFLCPDDHFTFSVDAKTQGGALAGVYLSGEAEQWKDVTTTGASPLDNKTGSGSFTGRFSPANTREGIKIQLRMVDGGYGAFAEYHYEPTNEKPPTHPPEGHRGSWGNGSPIISRGSRSVISQFRQSSSHWRALALALSTASAWVPPKYQSLSTSLIFFADQTRPMVQIHLPLA